MTAFKELLGDVSNIEGDTKDLDEGITNRAASILGAAVIISSYEKVKAERNLNKKIDRLADLIFTSSAQVFHTLKKVEKK